MQVISPLLSRTVALLPIDFQISEEEILRSKIENRELSCIDIEILLLRT